MIESSSKTGKLMCGKRMRGEVDAEAYRKYLTGRWDFILDFDLEKHEEDAKKIFRDLQAAAVRRRRRETSVVSGMGDLSIY